MKSIMGGRSEQDWGPMLSSTRTGETAHRSILVRERDVQPDFPYPRKLGTQGTQAIDEGAKQLPQPLPDCKIHHQPLPLTDRLFQKLVRRGTSRGSTLCD